jgi:hypothetical protein
MSTLSTSPVTTNASNHQHQAHVVREGADGLESFTYQHRPTGADILKSAGRPVDADQVVMQILRGGGLEDLRLDEAVNLALGDKFVFGIGDRLFRFTVNGKQCIWPQRYISAHLIQVLAGVDDDQSVRMTQDGAEVFLAPTDVVDLSQPGVEHFVTVKHEWVLIVGGVRLIYTTPLVTVEEALQRAKFDTSKAWNIYLIVKGRDKQELQLSSVVDLRTPGIEKIRVTPRNVGNGDAQATAVRREFALLPADVEYMDEHGIRWETVLDGERRWLLIRDFALPTGYSPAVTLLALDIPKDYPAAQIDMFYFAPAAALADGRVLPSVQVTVVIHGITFQGWSRHRNAPHLWDPSADCVRTHMALVEACLAKELEQ